MHAQKGAFTAQAQGQAPSRKGKRPLRGQLWGAKVTGPSAFRVAGAEPGGRLSASRPSLQERPQRPRERAGHLDKPPPERATAKGRPEEY